MSSVPVTMLVAAVLSLLAAPAPPAPPIQKDPSASGGFVILPDAGATSALAGGSIQNPTMYDVYVTTASAEVAAGVEFREIQNGNPRPLKVLTVPAYESLELKPGATELVLTGLKRPLAEGETLTIELKTDGGATLRLAAVVKRR